jgi:hypothetical protein
LPDCALVHDIFEAMVIIPPDSLSPAALRGVIEAFVLREGTDYGHEDYSLEAKCRAVERQLREGRAEICFDPVTESTDIRPVERK